MFWYGLGMIVTSVMVILNPDTDPKTFLWVGAAFCCAAAINAGIKGWIRSKP